MKILFFSDMHFHNWNYGAGIKDGFNTRLLSQIEVFKEINESAIAEDVDLIIFAGDLFHTHGKIDAAVMQQVTEAFLSMKWDGQMFIMVGNHDMASRSGKIHSLATFKQKFKVIDQPYVYNNLALHPFTESKEDLEFFLSTLDNDKTIVLHQGVSGVPVNSSFVLPNEILEPNMVARFQHTFTGHYHNHRRVTDNLTIIGAPMQHNRGDIGQRRGWVVYDIVTGEIKHFESKAPKFIETNGTSTEGVAGNFIIVKNPQGDSETIRDSLRCKGALSVEFSLTEKENFDNSELKYHNFQLEDIITKYSELNKLSKYEIEIGNQIRQGTYEAN